MMAGEDFSQLREGFLAAVLLVSADEHDSLSPAGSVAAWQGEPGIVGPGAGDQEAEEQAGHESFHGVKAHEGGGCPRGEASSRLAGRAGSP